MTETRINPETEKQFIVTTYIDLTRHGSRFGGPMELTFYDGATMKFDDSTNLTPRGKEGAKEFGATYPEEVTLVRPWGGDESRHGESREDILVGSEKFGAATEVARALEGKPRKYWGSSEGEKKYGTVHVAVGSNGTFGRTSDDPNFNSAKVYCDMVLGLNLGGEITVECVKNDGDTFTLIEGGKPVDY